MSMGAISHSRSRRRKALGLLAQRWVITPVFLAATFLSSCSTDDKTPFTPIAPQDNSATSDGWIVEFRDEASLTTTLAKQPSGLVDHDPACLLARFAGGRDVTELRALPGALRVERNWLAGLPSSAINASSESDELGFHESDELGFHEFAEAWSALPLQDGLSSLGLTTVHALAQGAGIRVAVLDTGVDLSHPFLAGRIVVPDGFSAAEHQDSGNGIDDDGDGAIDEGLGHGTHVAGIIATVAPLSTIVPFRVLSDEGIGSAYDIAVALAAASAMNVDVVNMSLSLSGSSTIIETELAAMAVKGIVVLAAVGNHGGAIAEPAASANTIAIASVDALDVLAASSAFGPSAFAAPGVAIGSCFPGGGYASGSGSSMATGVASGCVALLLSAPTSAGMSALIATTRAVTPSDAAPWGRLDPLAALTEF
jgi:hypothetical protein